MPIPNCKHWKRGYCLRGSGCRFAHAAHRAQAGTSCNRGSGSTEICAALLVQLQGRATAVQQADRPRSAPGVLVHRAEPGSASPLAAALAAPRPQTQTRPQTPSARASRHGRRARATKAGLGPLPRPPTTASPLDPVTALERAHLLDSAFQEDLALALDEDRVGKGYRGYVDQRYLDQRYLDQLDPDQLDLAQLDLDQLDVALDQLDLDQLDLDQLDVALDQLDLEQLDLGQLDIALDQRDLGQLDHGQLDIDYFDDSELALVEPDLDYFDFDELDFDIEPAARACTLQKIDLDEADAGKGDLGRADAGKGDLGRADAGKGDCGDCGERNGNLRHLGCCEQRPGTSGQSGSPWRQGTQPRLGDLGNAEDLEDLGHAGDLEDPCAPLRDLCAVDPAEAKDAERTDTQEPTSVVHECGAMLSWDGPVFSK